MVRTVAPAASPSAVAKLPRVRVGPDPSPATLVTPFSGANGPLALTRPGAPANASCRTRLAARTDPVALAAQLRDRAEGGVLHKIERRRATRVIMA
ncbi:hypothetical protein GCM10023170_092600 [Phytohabitans houttuyneae]|uniref:Uncharacterized protein n=1 Tax=Phytohabitans houttuyneae TaxID=1076126 RepID=A0A6V8K5N4_9ACTN|nr:hypothetical protein Phou_014760 [Phytohabitans houttuyneae]